jgi:hypothetical protein
MEKKVIGCEIKTQSEPRDVVVQFDDMEIKKIFSFYSDEINFTLQELIGLTESECRELFYKKDKEFLLS